VIVSCPDWYTRATEHFVSYDGFVDQLGAPSNRRRHLHRLFYSDAGNRLCSHLYRESFSQDSTVPSFTLSLDQNSHQGKEGNWQPTIQLILYIKYEKHAEPFEIQYTFENPQINLDIIGWITWALHAGVNP
jgi:hypothetical protein